MYIYGGGSTGINSYDNCVYTLEIDPEPDIFNKKISIKKSKDKIIKGIKVLYNNKQLSDVEIIVENVSFYCHKFILSLLCEKFKSMFTSGLRESIKSRIAIKNHKHKHFEVFLKYLYYGEINENDIENYEDDSSICNSPSCKALITNDKLKMSININNSSVRNWDWMDYCCLLKISDEFLVNELNEWCQARISKRITLSNFSIILSFAKKYSSNILLDYCNWFYKENGKGVSIDEFTFSDVSSEYQSSAFSLDFK
jgi:hypothetical protein